MHRIAFTANHGRTRFFAAVSEQLPAETYWIETGGGYVGSFLKNVPETRRLDISYDGRPADGAVLRLIDEHSELSSGELVLADRNIRGWKGAEAYLCCIFTKVSEFLSSNDINAVFGEATWAHELVTAAVCRYLRIPFLCPVNVRFPSERFAFFEGIFQREFALVRSEDNNLLDRFLERRNSPFYMMPRKKKTFTPLIRHALRYLSGDIKDMTMPPLSVMIRNRLRFPGNVPGADKPSGRYVYLPLHCRQEAALDVTGGIYRDQLLFVREIAGRIPDGLVLAVREHPLYKDSVRFYRELACIDKVEMISTAADHHGLVQGAEAVVSVSGTACYEAGLYGVPAVVFSRVFFERLPTVKYCGGMGRFAEVLASAMDGEPDISAVQEFLAEVYGSSFEGYAESPDVYPEAMSDENVSKAAAGFRKILEVYSSPKSSTADSI